MWDKRGVDLERLEWTREPSGALSIERKLPNGVSFGARITPTRDEVRMRMWITNGTKAPLSGLVVQNCVMLKAAAGFEPQTNDNKVFDKPYAACRNADGTRWIITAWKPCVRAWANAPCPCLHSDPQFPDCAPGETQHVRGWLSFYEGNDVRSEFRRIDTSEWWNRQSRYTDNRSWATRIEGPPAAERRRQTASRRHNSRRKHPPHGAQLGIAGRSQLL